MQHSKKTNAYLPPCCRCEGGARLASGMLAFRAAITLLLASFTASFSAANAAICFRGGFSLGLPSASVGGGAFLGPGRSLLLLSAAALPASACSACMCCCSCGAGCMEPQ